MSRPATSVLNLPQFRVQWRDVTRISEDVISGMTEAQAAETLTSESPILVYVYDGEAEEDLRFSIEEEKAFYDDKVAIGARFFDCVRIDAESALEDRAIAKKVRRLPALLFVRPNYEVAATLSGKFNASKIYSAMVATLKKDYTNKVASVVKTQKKIQKERATLQRDWVKVNALDEKIGDEESARRRAKLEKERDALAAKLNEEEGKLTEKEIKLYELAPKERSTA